MAYQDRSYGPSTVLIFGSPIKFAPIIPSKFIMFPQTLIQHFIMQLALDDPLALRKLLT